MDAKAALKRLEDMGIEVRLDGDLVRLKNSEALSKQDMARLKEMKPDIVAELKRRPPSGAFFYDQKKADVRSAEAALQGGHERYCACGSLGTNGVGRVKWSKRNPEGVERWVCEDCFKSEFGTH